MDILLVSTAFLFGFAAKQMNLPPLVGFLVAGFALNAFDIQATQQLHDLADIGIILMLFSIGLKVQVKKLFEPQIWAVASIHMVLMVVILGCLVFGFSLAGLLNFAGLTLSQSLLIAFGLSFSSTVFAVKILEERGEAGSTQGRISIGILIMQDLFAVLFITISSGKMPSVTALGLVGLFLLRKPLFAILNRTGHGELLVLLACILPIAGASLFEAVGMKPDLGALVLGMLLAGHSKTDELAKAMFGFKDMFLVGFFLTIGMADLPNMQALLSASLLILLIPIKVVAFFLLFTRFSLRARTSLLSSMNLANYSEFGLIVGALGVSQGWLGSEWLVIMAIALSISMLLASPASTFANKVYNKWNARFQKFESLKRLPGDTEIDMGNASVAIFGMGRVGTGAYDNLSKQYGRGIIGVDSDVDRVAAHIEGGRRVVAGDAEDYDFWQRGISEKSQIVLILLTMSHSANLAAARQIAAFKTRGVMLASTALFDDEIEPLKAAGVDVVFNVYSGAGLGFSDYIWDMMDFGQEKEDLTDPLEQKAAAS